METFGIDSLTSHILCDRHNTALSWLDDAAGRTFRILQKVCVDIKSKSLSRRGQWFLISGEALELWGLKILFGLYHAKLATNQHVRVNKTHTLDVARFIGALDARQLPPPCGLYLHALQGGSVLSIEEKVTTTPLSSERGNLLVGIRLGMHGLKFDIIMNPYGVNFSLLQQQAVFHPWQMSLGNRWRQHRLVITWQDRTSSDILVEFSTLAPLR